MDRVLLLCWLNTSIRLYRHVACTAALLTQYFYTSLQACSVYCCCVDSILLQVSTGMERVPLLCWLNTSIRLYRHVACTAAVLTQYFYKSLQACSVYCCCVDSILLQVSTGMERVPLLCWLNTSASLCRHGSCTAAVLTQYFYKSLQAWSGYRSFVDSILLQVSTGMERVPLFCWLNSSASICRHVSCTAAVLTQYLQITTQG